MKQLKKFLFLIICLIAVISICRESVSALEQEEQPNPPEDFQYDILEGSAYIHYYLGDSPTVIVPKEIEGVPVRGIGDIDEIRYLGGSRGDGFECEDEYLIKKIVIPSTVQAVGEYAFVRHKGIEELIIEDGASFPMTYIFFTEKTWKRLRSVREILRFPVKTGFCTMQTRQS